MGADFFQLLSGFPLQHTLFCASKCPKTIAKQNKTIWQKKSGKYSTEGAKFDANDDLYIPVMDSHYFAFILNLKNWM